MRTASKPSGPKWRRRAEARPDEILDAALDEFNERGFDGARVEDIAQRANISKAGLYLYFASKEELLRELVEREIAPIARKMRELAEAGADDPRGTLGALVAALTAVISNPRVFAVPRLVLSVAGRFPELAQYYRENVVEQGLSAMRFLHRAGVMAGAFRNADSDVVARAVIGPVFAYAMMTHVLGADPGDSDPAGRARAQLDILFNGLAA